MGYESSYIYLLTTQLLSPRGEGENPLPHLLLYLFGRPFGLEHHSAERLIPGGNDQKIIAVLKGRHHYLRVSGLYRDTFHVVVIMGVGGHVLQHVQDEHLMRAYGVEFKP